MARPGPGQVIAFSKQVNNGRSRSSYADGVQKALAWALGQENKHPITGEASKDYPPDMTAIRKISREAQDAIKQPRRFDRHYCRGVQETLAWIHSSLARRPHV